MPMADQLQDHGRLVRTLIYGKDKTKKTWWACRAAEDGYNVILLDGDDGATITRNLPPEAQKKILIVNVCDTAKTAVFTRFMATFNRGKPFLWDEQNKVSLAPNTKRNPEHSYVYFDTEKFTGNDVVIIDSWTALAMSTAFEFANETDTDLAQVERDGDNFAMPNYQARFLDLALGKVKTYNAHAIVIGHETNYEKGKGKGKDRKIVGDYIQPISSTGPQGQKLGKFFENVLRFTRLSDISYSIDAGGDDSRSGGSRLLPPQKFNWKDITPQKMMESLGAKPTGELCHGAIWIPPGGELIIPGNIIAQNSQQETAIKPSVQAEPVQPKVLTTGSTLAQKIALSKMKPK